MIKAVLFDFDGVLTLDETGSQSICNYISSKIGIDKNIFTPEYRKYNSDLLSGKIKHEEIWGKICASIGYKIKIDILYDSFVNTPLNSEMLNLVQEVKSKNYKIGMVTDNKADRIKNIVEYHQWQNIFDGIVVSAEIGSGKTQENIFFKIFQILSVNPEECIFIDNNKENLIIPKNLGVKTIFYDYTKKDIIKLKTEIFDLLTDE